MKSSFSTLATQRVTRALILLGALATSLRVTQAATFTVTNTADSGVGSLRQAITDANSAATDDAIIFDVAAFAAPRKTIILTGTQLPVVTNSGTLSIAAPKAGVILSGNSSSRIFQVAIGANLLLTNLTLSNGLGNVTPAGVRVGGAIFNEGTVSLNACTLNANRAGFGGAIYSESSGSSKLTLRNCTLAANTATNGGGGLYNAFGVAALDSCTIKGNTAPDGFGSGVLSTGNPSTRTEVRNSIIAENVDSVGNRRSDVDFSGNLNTFQSNGYNLIGTGNAIGQGGPRNSGEFVEIGDQANIFSAGLGVLSENGGPTRTYDIHPQTQSPARNMGNTDLTTDQRGAARPFGSADDIGAFEANYQPSAPTVNAPITVIMNETFSVSATSRDPENQPVTYTFVLRKGTTVLFTATNASGRATFDLSMTNLESTADVLMIDVSANDGQVDSVTISANITVAEPNSLIVTTLSDNSTNLDGLTSLREAVTYTNRAGDTAPEVISFSVAGTINLQSAMPGLNVASTSGTLTIRNTLTSAITISGGSSQRFFVLFGATNLTLDGLTLTAFNGSALINNGLLTINNCTLSNSQSSFNDGGAVLNDESGTLIMMGCTLSSNTASGGGAVSNRGTATISNCTFFNNTGNNNGGAILNDKALTLVSSTLSGNSARRGGGIASGSNGPATLNLRNNLIVGNNAPTDANISGVYSDGGNNRLVGTAIAAGLQTDSNGTPILSDNGGPTKTIALLSSSLAVNTGNTDLTFDQRGVARPQAGAHDIGAFELVLPVASSNALINEFRTSGPSGALDEFIEIYNQTNVPLDLAGWTLVSNGVTVGIIPTGKAIPPYGRLLLTGSTYSLATYGGTGGASDVALTGDVVPTGTLELRNSGGIVVDTVTPSTLAAPTSATSNYSYVRRMDGPGGAATLGSAFNTVDVNSTSGPGTSSGTSDNLLRLGAPGPQNLSSPTVANNLITFVSTGAPTRTGSGDTGTLAFRNTITNRAGSGRTLTALRFRLVAVTAGTTPTGTSDIRLASSSAGGTVLPLILETPPAQPLGGGLNTSGTVSLSSLPGGGLAPGQSVTVEFLFTIFQRGAFRYLVNLEPNTTVATAP